MNSPVGASKGGARRATMGDIAVHLGVSRQLVSAVLRDAPGASPANRERVRRAAQELGYSPHVAAQMLRRARSRHIGVIFTLNYSFDADMVDCLYAQAQDRGYDMVLSAMTGSRDEEQAVRELRGFRTEAIVVVGPNTSTRVLQQAGMDEPMVVFGRRSEVAGVDSVRSDDAAGAASAVRHLVELGHQDIVHVDGADLPGARERREGYLHAMAACGLSHRQHVLRGDYTEESGAAAAAALLTERVMPTAIVAGNDNCAVGVIDMLTRQGYRVPDDVAVTGFDDSRLSRMSYRQMTTVRQDVAALSAAALDTVVERIANPATAHKDIMLPTSLVVRETSAPPSRRA